MQHDQRDRLDRGGQRRDNAEGFHHRILPGLAPGRVEVGAWVLVGQLAAELLRGLRGVFLDAPPEPAQRHDVATAMMMAIP